MCVSKPKVPRTIVAAAPQAPQEQDQSVTAAADAERRRRRSADSGRQSTILSGGQGLTSPASIGYKSLLGQ